MALVALCGGPCSGKTTLARALTNELSMRGHVAEHIHEYARTHIAQCDKSKKNNPRSLLHQAVILPKQLEWEDAVQEAVEFVVSDSPVLIHSVYTYDTTDFDDYNEKVFYLQYYQQLLELKDRYDYVFFLPPGDIGFKSDGLRKQDSGRAHDIGKRIEAFLIFHNITYITIRGTVEERLAKCLDMLIGE